MIKRYHALLFPTYYEGEGVAGTLIDAMAAGVPVIASDWRYNSEVVIDGKTGVLFKTRKCEELINCLRESICNIEAWKNMKANCINECKKYTSDVALQILLTEFD